MVHQHHGAACGGDHARRALVEGQCRDIVDHRGAGAERRFHHGRLARVDRDRGAGPGKLLDHRQHALYLVSFPDRARARAGGFAADVDDRRARRRHGMAGLCGGRSVLVPAAIREAVRGDVENGRDLRLIETDHPLADLQRRAAGR
jgi:hypothetical protein